MKGKGWWIAGGILLLWISPLFWGIASSHYKQHQQELHQKRVEAWNRRVEEHLRPKYSEAERLRLKAGYDQAMKEAADRWADTEVRILINSRRPVAWIGTPPPEPPNYGEIYRNVMTMYPSSTPAYQQPDLSGLYYSRQIVGPNAGQWSINYLNGPN